MGMEGRVKAMTLSLSLSPEIEDKSLEIEDDSLEIEDDSLEKLYEP